MALPLLRAWRKRTLAKLGPRYARPGKPLRADAYEADQVILECPVWMAPVLQGFDWVAWCGGRVQSCVRPVGAVHMTAGHNAFR